ncbi:MAG TPA: MerR family transcriptional regulator [Pseudonocardia sp.]|nr:MerR family transcriptional regulator [Pseudonocardia sp.]
MRLSELASTTGTSIPTIKFYIRQGLLPPGRPASARQAEYGDPHVERIRLVRALVEVGGLSLGAVRAVLDALSGPGGTAAAVAVAHQALGPEPAVAAPPHRARRALDLLGWDTGRDIGDGDDDPGRAVQQLEAALAAVEAVGLAPDEDRLRAYADAATAVARVDVAGVAGPRSAAGDDGVGSVDPVRYVVLGTILYEPLLLALRRLAQQRAFREAGGPDADRGP